MVGVDEIAESMAYDIIAYGDCFIRLPRNSELAINQVKSTSDRALNENILLNVTNKQLGHYAGIIEKVDNPGEMYDLRQNGKCAGFIKVPLAIAENPKVLALSFIALPAINSQTSLTVSNSSSPFIHFIKAPFC